MKQGKKLTLKMKQFLAEKGLDCEKYLVERNTPQEISFINKDTKEIINFEGDWRNA